MKHIKPTINLSSSGQVNRIDFIKTDTKPSVNEEEIKSLKMVAETLQHKLEEIKRLLKITKFLAKNNISTFDEISNLECETTKSFLLNNHNDVFTILPINRLNEFQEHSYNYELLKKDLAFKKIYQQSILPSNVNELEKAIEEEVKNISIEEAKREYLKQSNKDIKFKMFCENYKPSISLEAEQDYLITLDNLQDLEDNFYILDKKRQELHYKNIINGLDIEQKYVKQALSILETFIKQRKEFKGLPTPNDTTNLIKGIEKGINLIELYKEYHKKNDLNALKILLEDLAPEVYNKILQSEEESIEVYIAKNTQETIFYIEGAKFDVLEDRIFCATRALAVNAYQQCIVDSPDRKITVSPADIYKLCGVPYDNGYDTTQRLAIKTAATNKKGNLLKGIYIQYKQDHKDGSAILSTNFIKHMHWNDEKDQVIFEIDSMFFVDVPNQKTKNHWIDDIEGRIRFIATFKNGYQNKSAYKLHKHLACTLRETNKPLEYNVTTLLKASDLIKDFDNGNKKRALSKLQNYLNRMYKVGSLIKNQPVKVESKSDKLGKYLLERIY